MVFLDVVYIENQNVYHYLVFKKANLIKDYSGGTYVFCLFVRVMI